MRSRSPASLALAILALVPGACRGPDASRDSNESPALPRPDPTQQTMVEVGRPGPEHAELAKLVGSWDLKLRSRTDPAEDWTEVDGTMTAHPILGGRFVVEEWHAVVMDTPFEGFGLLGFDRLRGCYTSLWTDSFSTWTVTSTGARVGPGVIEFRGDMIDVVSPSGRPFRTVETMIDDDHIRSELFDSVGGVETRMGEVLGTRRR